MSPPQRENFLKVSHKSLNPIGKKATQTHTVINILSKPDHLNYENFYHFFIIAHRSEGAQEAPVKAQFQGKKDVTYRGRKTRNRANISWGQCT